MKVVSYNIWNGGEGRLEAVTQVLETVHADAIALLEAGDATTAAALGERLGMHVTFGAANSEFPIVWLTKSVVRRWTNHRDPVLAKTLLETEIEHCGAPLGLFATHLSPGTELTDCEAREREVDVILGLLSATNPRHLLVGDFNAVHPDDRMGIPPPDMEDATQTPWLRLARPIQRMLDAGYMDAYRVSHPRAPGFTWRTGHLWLRLDFAFISTSLAADLVDCDVVSMGPADRASDHLPLVVTIR